MNPLEKLGNAIERAIDEAADQELTKNDIIHELRHWIDIVRDDPDICE